MKKISIILGATVAIVALAIWGYLMFFGTPKSVDEVFSNFGIGDTDPVFPVENTNEEVGDEVDFGTAVASAALRQLTTKPVAGAVIIDGYVRYMERGTGHIYNMPLSGGTETLVSGTTIPQSIEAYFTRTGDKVIILTEENGPQEYIVGTIGTNEEQGVVGKRLPQGAREVGWNDTEDAVMYLVSTPSGSTGYSYGIDSAETKSVFSTPLRDIEVVWDTPITIYTTPSETQMGHVYNLTANTLSFVHKGGLGLMAIKSDEDTILSYTEDGIRSSYIVEKNGVAKLPNYLFPEKCTGIPDRVNTLYCATPQDIPKNIAIPDDWYKGTHSFTDALWEIDTTTRSARYLVDMLSTTGREVDVSQIGTDREGAYIWFINKNDDSLWLFDTTQALR